jgi:negative regulator of sigma E activity
MDSFFARNRLSAYLDGALSEAEAAEVSEAVEHDPELRAEFEALQHAVEVLRREGPVQAPVGFHARVMERVRDEPAPGGVVVQLRRVFTRVPVEALALAAAAAVVLVVIGGKPDLPADDTTSAARNLQLPSSGSPDAAGPSSSGSTRQATAPEPGPAPAQTKGTPNPPSPKAAPAVDDAEQKRGRKNEAAKKKSATTPSEPMQAEWEKTPQVGDYDAGDAATKALATPHGYRLTVRDENTLYSMAQLAERYQGSIRDMAGRTLRPRALTLEDDYAQLLFVVPNDKEAVVHGDLRALGGAEVVPPSTTPLTSADRAVFVVEVRYQP